MENRKNKILIIDDERDLCYFTAKNLEGAGNFEVSYALTGESGLECVTRFRPDVIFLDLNLPDSYGVSLIKKILGIHAKARVIILTGRGTHDNMQAAFRNGAVDFITKPFGIKRMTELISKYLDVEVEEKKTVLGRSSGKHITKDLFLDILESFVSISEAKSIYLKGHSERVARVSRQIGEQMGISKARLEILEDSAVLHDIGKIQVRDSVLDKDGTLSPEEFEHIKCHPVVGSEIIDRIRLFRLETPLVRFHHEHFDGTGYPDGLRGEEIPLGSRIIAVADAYDAMTSERSYRRRMTDDRALAEIERCSGTQFDPRVVEAFLKAKEQTKESETKTT